MLLADQKTCTGCMACVASCPQKCINITPDHLGHLYPRIESKTCINCGNCQKACPTMCEQTGKPIQKAYAAWSLDPKNRQSSASGGAAAEFYQHALLNGYWICGAEYQDDYHVIHTVKRDASAIVRYKQSKYVYSDIRDSYHIIKQLLLRGEHVLCISLPCKIAGLLSYLGHTYDNLVTVDIVCHGTPSHQNLVEHIRTVTSTATSDSVAFREDNEFIFSLEYKGKSIYRCIGREDAYLAAFLEGLNYRESCYNCSYAQSKRISDITICDFWGLGTELPFDHPYSGSISAVLVNSEKGQMFFNLCKNHLFIEERPITEVVKGNAQLNSPTPIHPRRKEFETLYQNAGFDVAVSTILHKEMLIAKKENYRNNLRKKARKCAGIFLKKYRG